MAAKKDTKQAAGGRQSKKKKTAVVSQPLPMDYVPRMKKDYDARIHALLMETFHLKNTMVIPRLTKICINVGLGEATQNPKVLEAALDEVSLITGQKPVVTLSRKAISNFKLRAGMPIGCRVTLRRFTMYEFLDRLITLALPRIRDFRGISDKGFDGRGNYTLGVREQIIFPEINYDKVDTIHGMDISFITTAPTDEQAYHLLREFGMPFRKK